MAARRSDPQRVSSRCHASAARPWRPRQTGRHPPADWAAPHDHPGHETCREHDADPRRRAIGSGAHSIGDPGAASGGLLLVEQLAETSLSQPVQEHPMIAVEHLVKQYGRFTAVDDISLDVQPGEIHGFLGPNGAGKTTTLRMIPELL